MSAAATRRTQVERRTEAEDRLLRAAAELIGEVGPAGVTLAKVGERAGYSRGLAAHHFGSKAALMERVADVVAGDFDAALRAAQVPGGTVVDELLALVRVYVDVALDPPVLNRARLVLIADAVAHADADARAVVVAAGRTFRRHLVARLAAASDVGALATDVDLEALATTVMGLLRGTTFESMLDPEVDLHAVRREVEALVVARLAVPPS